MDYNIKHNLEDHRFEIELDGYKGYLEYIVVNGGLDIIHTIVPGQIGGRGVAAALVEAALLYARANDMKVIPSCSYVAVYIRRHPEYAPMVM